MKTTSFVDRKVKAKPVSRFANEFRHFMAELDPGLLLQHPDKKNKGRWHGRFIIASWVRFPEGLNQRVNLVLVYRDSERRKSFKIDTCRANRQTLILLNGTVETDIVGDVTDIALVLEGLSENSVWILDEFRVEPAGSIIRATKKVTSLVSA